MISCSPYHKLLIIRITNARVVDRGTPARTHGTVLHQHQPRRHRLRPGTMASDVSAHHALSHHKDGLTYVLENHAHFCSLISQYKQTTSAAAKLAMAAQLGRDFARHASAVERFLCPLVTAKLPFATKALVDRSGCDHV